MKNALRTTGALTGITLVTLANSLDAQLPFFTGQRGPTYGVETRVEAKEDNSNVKAIAKTFRDEIPAWAYLGNSYTEGNGLGDPFYGMGATLNLKDRLYMLPTVEGVSDDFSGVSLYTTLSLGGGYHIDFTPTFDDNLDYNNTSFNLAKTHKGITFGASSNIADGKLRRFRDTDWRIAKVKKGNFISGSVNFGNKKVRVSVQRRFK